MVLVQPPHTHQSDLKHEDAGSASASTLPPTWRPLLLGCMYLIIKVIGFLDNLLASYTQISKQYEPFKVFTATSSFVVPVEVNLAL